MDIQKAHLTLKLMKSLVPGRQCRICDTEISGLQVWIGAKSIAFYLRKRGNGKEYTVKLGNWPAIALDEARRKALDKLGAIANYGDANAPTGRLDPTVQDAMDYYFQTHSNPGTLRNAKSLFRNFAGWGSRRIKDITVEDLKEVYARQNGSPTTAAASVNVLVSAFKSLNRKIGLQYTPPPVDFASYKYKPRVRYITKEEIPRFFAALDKFAMSKYAMRVDIVYMLLYTGARVANVCEMRLEEISPTMLWTIPASKYKGKRDQAIQLGSFEASIVEKYRRGRTSGYVFPHERPLNTSFRYFFAKLCKEAGLEDFHIHDIRRTLGTWMLSNGTPIAIISKKLGHSSIGITERVYANAMPDVASLATDQAIAAMRSQNGTSS